MRTLLTLPLTVLTVGALSLGTASPAAAKGGSVTCSFTRTTTAAVTSVTLPETVRGGSTVDAEVTISRSAGNGPARRRSIRCAAVASDTSSAPRHSIRAPLPIMP